MPDRAGPLVADARASGSTEDGAEGDPSFAGAPLDVALVVCRDAGTRDRDVVFCEPYTTYAMTAATRSEMSRFM
jgi:hypothetical protein